MFVGAKMLLVDVVKIPTTVSLATIGGILALSVGASWWRSRVDAGPDKAAG